MSTIITPAISAIIPTQGRSELICKMLESLVRSSSNYPGQFESIVVDSSKGRDAEEIMRACIINNTRYVPGSESVREKRNLGAELARGEVLLFIDSDCVASPNLILEHARIYQEHQDVAGVCGVTEFTGHKGLHWWIIEQSGLLDAFSFAKKYNRVQWCTTSNVSIRRDVFWSEGGFDEKFPFRLGGDDLDITYRITSKGRLILSNASAIVFHTTETWSSFRSVGERAFRWGRMGYHVFKKHKELQYFDLPKPMMVLLVIFILYFTKAGRSKGMADFWVVAVAVGFFLSVIIFVIDKRIIGWRRLLIPLSWVYKTIYRGGLVLEFLLNRDLRFVIRKTMFSNYQLVDEWPLNVKMQWNMLICFIWGWLLWLIIR